MIENKNALLVIEIEIDDPEDEWRCIQQMINALFNEKKTS